MKYRTLGNTGIQVSEVAMGSEGIEGKSYEELKYLLETCLECGINCKNAERLTGLKFD